MVVHCLWFARGHPWAKVILVCEPVQLAGGEGEGLVGPLTEGTTMTTGSLAKKIEQKSVLRCDERASDGCPLVDNRVRDAKARSKSFCCKATEIDI